MNPNRTLSTIEVFYLRAMLNTIESGGMIA